MKPITLPMAELKPALTGLGKLIQKSHGLPVLKTVKIERTAEGWVSLTATDLDAFATVRLEPLSFGSAACSTDAKKASASRWTIIGVGVAKNPAEVGVARRKDRWRCRTNAAPGERWRGFESWQARVDRKSVV